MNEIYQAIADAITRLTGNNHETATLKIKRLEGNVSYQGSYFTPDGEKKYLEVWELKLKSGLIHELYELTQNSPMPFTDWNRAVFTLKADNSFDMEYIWDQELQDLLDAVDN